MATIDIDLLGLCQNQPTLVIREEEPDRIEHVTGPTLEERVTTLEGQLKEAREQLAAFKELYDLQVAWWRDQRLAAEMAVEKKEKHDAMTLAFRRATEPPLYDNSQVNPTTTIYNAWERDVFHPTNAAIGKRQHDLALNAPYPPKQPNSN